MSEIKDARVAKALTTALKTKDLVVVAGAFAFFIRRGEPGSEPVLISALNKHGDVIMAVFILNCGNSQLEQAARAWGKAHGYKISSSAWWRWS